MDQEIRNIADWTPACLRRVVLELQEGKRRKGEGAMFFNKNRLSPLAFYCYLKARFGEPNGFQMLLKKPNDSDNLIHWHYSIVAGEETLEIMGMNSRVEFWSNTKVALSEEDQDELLHNIRDDFKNFGKDIGKVRKSLEHWRLFINPFSRLKGVIEQARSKLVALDLTIPPPENIGPNHDKDRFPEEMRRYLDNITNAVFLCTTIRMVAPVYAESFVNFLVFFLAKQEVKDDDRVYQDLVRKQIDIRVKSLPLYCNGLAKAPSDQDEPFKDFLRLMNSRNDVLHGNIDPQMLKFDEVWFDGYTPLFKDEKIFAERATYHSLKHIEPEQVLGEVRSVDNFIEYLLSILEPGIRKQVELLMNDPYPGWREDTKRVGKLFPGSLVDIQPAFEEQKS